MLIVISQQIIEKMYFLQLNVHLSSLCHLSKVIKCNNQSIFTNCVSFLSGPITISFFNSEKRLQSFKRLRLPCLSLKETLLKCLFKNFTKTNIASCLQF